MGPNNEPERRAPERRVNNAGVLELVYQNDQKHDEAHRRMRHDLTEFEERMVESMRRVVDTQHALQREVSQFVATPVDVTKMVFTPKIVVGVIIMVMSIAGTVWTINSGLRSDVRDILTRMASEQRVSDANAKMIEQNSNRINQALETNGREMKASIDAVNKRQDLLTLQYNQLSEQLTKLAAQRER